MQAERQTGTSATTPQDPPPATMSPAWAVTGLGMNLFTPVVTVYWCLRARAEWIAAYPEKAERRPPTVSKAISDPAIGDPFAFWVTTAAIVSLVGMVAIAMLYARMIHATPRADERERRHLRRTATGLVLMQVPLSLGMIMLSQFSLGATDDLHMAGSYIFFTAAALVNLLGVMTSLSVLSLVRRDPAMARRGLIQPLAARVRLWASGATVALAVVYLFLFIAKDTALGSPELYQTYVTTEVVLIAGFSTILLLHCVEFARILVTYRGRSAAASQRPAGTSATP